MEFRANFDMGIAQEFWGHSDVKTSMAYTYVRNPGPAWLDLSLTDSEPSENAIIPIRITHCDSSNVNVTL